MTNRKKYIIVAMVVTATGFGYITSSHRNIPSDLRDAVADNGDFDTSLPILDKNGDDIPVPQAAAVDGISKGYVDGNDPSAGAPTNPVEWVTIPAGKFRMGIDSDEKGFEDAKPKHEVAINTFDVSKTVVTVEQYAECVIKGGCTKPGADYECNWGKTDRQLHPVTCVNWDQAQAYAKFKGARLPSEAEFEYAATSGGKNQKYPWGNEEATSELAVMSVNRTMPVCSKPKGNTEQGLCDMSGNVWQWVQDKYKDSYKGAPADGSAFAGAGPNRVMRGGSFSHRDTRLLRTGYRAGIDPGYPYDDIGFRLARSRR